MGLFLVTTADERTWKFDRPVLFLGEWCRRYDRKTQWTTMDAIVAIPYGLGEENKDKIYAYVSKLYEDLLVELCLELNDYHQTDYSLRYWRIVLGNWLYRYTSVIFNRWFTLQQALHHYEVSGTTILDATSYSLATQDSASFMRACNDDVWNHVLYAKILNHFANVNLVAERKSLGDTSEFTIKNESSVPKGKRTKQLIRKVAVTMFGMLSRDNDAFIINSYLPLKEEIKLQLILGQVPKMWQTPSLKSIKVDRALRKRLAINESNYQEFDQFVRAMLMETLPMCYLEGYQALSQKVQALPWPKNPKYIFTSNNFDTDEIFKIWAGWKTEQGVPYFIGQHGNNYGTLKNCSGEMECVSTSDKFITWGWVDGNPKHTPAFILNMAGHKKIKINEDGGVLLIEQYVPFRRDPWDSYSEYLTYQDEQFRFVENLPGFIQQELTVRLQPGHKLLDWSDEQRWKDRSPGTRIEDGTAGIRDLISNSRLVVHSYDSTGVLETLSLNIPTICFWHGGLGHLRASARPYYEQLMHAGILFDTPEMAAEKVSEVWKNVPAWWSSDEVQNARKIFCNRFSRTVDKPIQVLKEALNSVANPSADGKKA